MQRNVILPLRAEPPICLPCRRLEIPAQQRRLQGRFAMEPVLDLSGKGFRCSAVIDWVDVDVELRDDTQSRHLSDHLAVVIGRNPRVDGIDPATGRLIKRNCTGRHFRVRVQEPKHRLLVEMLRAASDRWGLIGEEALSGIEVSVDFYAKDQTELSRRQMVGVLQRHFFPSEEYISRPGAQLRYAYERADPTTRRGKSFPILVDGCKLPVDATMYCGKRGKLIAWRIMDKISDQRRGDHAVNLPLHRRRARIEVTFDAATTFGMGLERVEDLMQFDFSKLRGRCFEFRLPTFQEEEWLADDPMGLSEKRWEAFSRSGVCGVMQIDRRQIRYRNLRERRAAAPDSPTRPRAGMGEHGWLVAHHQLNKRVGDALRTLRV